MQVTIIDYGSGNIKSVAKAFELAAKMTRQNYKITVSADPKIIKKTDKIVLPGQGSFKQCAQALNSINGMVDELNEHVINKKKSIFGICVGMQLFSDFGEENGGCEGFGWIKGKVKKINIHNTGDKLPHMGWNEVDFWGDNRFLFYNLKNGDHFYFVHSYRFDVEEKKAIIMTTYHGEKITCGVLKDNIFGTQFHPEKSQNNGMKLLYNFLKF